MKGRESVAYYNICCTCEKVWMAGSPTAWQPFRLSCFRKPPHRLARFSTTPPSMSTWVKNRVRSPQDISKPFNFHLELEQVDSLPV